MTESISLGVMGLLNTLYDPDLSLVPGICLENCSFHPDFPVLLSLFVVGSDDFLDFLGFCCYVFCFHF